MGATFVQLRTRAQERVDMENGTGPVSTDSEWLSLINAGYLELWDEVANTFGDHFVSSTAPAALTGGAGASDITLPADFGRLRGLDRLVTTNFYEDVPAFSFAERNNAARRSYRLAGAVLQVRPENVAAGTYRLWYTPTAVLLDIAGTKVVDDRVAPWDEFIVLCASIKAATKEESDVSVLVAEKETMRKRIQVSARRDSSRPNVVTDVSAITDGLSLVGNRYMFDP